MMGLGEFQWEKEQPFWLGPLVLPSILYAKPRFLGVVEGRIP